MPCFAKNGGGVLSAAFDAGYPVMYFLPRGVRVAFCNRRLGQRLLHPRCLLTQRLIPIQHLGYVLVGEVYFVHVAKVDIKSLIVAISFSPDHIRRIFSDPFIKLIWRKIWSLCCFAVCVVNCQNVVVITSDVVHIVFHPGDGVRRQLIFVRCRNTF